MKCGSLTPPSLALLGTYLLIMFGIDEIGLKNYSLSIFALALTMAVTIALRRRNCRLETGEARHD